MSMKKFLLMAVISLAGLVGIASAQSESNVSLQYLRVNPSVSQPNFKFDGATDSLGAVASITSYQNKNLGLTAEGSANFNSSKSSQIYTGLVGVTLKSRASATVQPFVKGLVGLGVSHVGQIGKFSSNSDTNVAFKASAGVDVGKNRVKFRVIELGLLKTYFYGQSQNNFVASTGITF